MIEQWTKLAVQAVSFAAFALVAARALYDWRRRRGGAPAIWLAATFGLLAAMILLTMVTGIIWGEEMGAPALLALGILIAAFPPALARFHATFGRRSRVLLTVVTAVSAVLVLWTVLLFAVSELPHAGEAPSTIAVMYLVVLAASWTSVSCWVAVDLWRSARVRPQLERARERTLAGALGVLVLGLFSTAVGIENVAGVLAGIAAVIVFLAYAPPPTLRNAWRRHDLERLRLSMGELMATTTRLDVGHVMLPSLASALGAHAIALFDHDGTVITSHAMDEAELEQAVRLIANVDERGPGDEFRLLGSMLWGQRAGLWLVMLTEGGFRPVIGREEYALIESTSWIMQVAFDRIRQINQLRQRGENLDAAQRLAGFGSFTYDVATESIEWSDTLFDTFGVDRDEPIDFTSYANLLHPEDRDSVLGKISDALASGRSYDVRHRFIRGDGEVRHMDCRGRAVRDEHDNIVGLTGVGQDVTEQMQLEEQLRSEYETEREATTRLKAIDAMKNTILSAVSHELRTPLTTVLGMALTLRDRRDQLDAAEQDQLLDHMAVESQRLEQLLADLLDLDRLRRGVIEPRLERVDVAELLRATLAPLDIEVECHFEEVTLALDTGKVQRIVENLVVNAARHTPAGTRVWLRATPCSPDGIEIRVEDDGPGIPADQRGNIFEPFNRGDQALGHAPGSGIGLALVQQFTELHGGKVWVEDRTGGGASFVVQLPDAIN